MFAGAFFRARSEVAPRDLFYDGKQGGERALNLLISFFDEAFGGELDGEGDIDGCDIRDGDHGCQPRRRSPAPPERYRRRSPFSGDEIRPRSWIAFREDVRGCVGVESGKLRRSDELRLIRTPCEGFASRFCWRHRSHRNPPRCGRGFRAADSAPFDLQVQGLRTETEPLRIIVPVIGSVLTSLLWGTCFIGTMIRIVPPFEDSLKREYAAIEKMTAQSIIQGGCGFQPLFSYCSGT